MIQIKQYVANPLVLILIITAGGLVLAGRFWDRYRTTLQQQPQFALSSDDVQMTPAPDWLPPAAQRQLLSAISSNGRSLLDPGLVEAVAGDLRQDPWIDQIVEVRKTPTHLLVNVRYGKPLLLELPERQVALINPKGEAVAAAEFPPGVAEAALRIAVRDLVQSPVQYGQPWPDRRVVLAAELAQRLQMWQDQGGLAGIYGLYLMDAARATPPQSPPKSLDRPVEFRLWTVGRNEIIWGSPVGQEFPDEATANEKIAGLAQYIRLHGPIDQGSDLPAKRGNVLDLRSGQLVVVRNAKQASEFSGAYR
ncbi:MAG: hypothetical protein JNK57_10670 [Planctomycetaceae bacterium]|nr:hypothetical protein [Planctomycetaceae bacterium]